MHRNRKSIRLTGYDYHQPGGYFITVVTIDRVCLFSEVAAEEMALNPVGKVILHWWQQIPAHFNNVECRSLVIMPNHIHGIILIHNEPPISAVGAGSPRLDDVIAQPGVGRPGVGRPNPYRIAKFGDVEHGDNSEQEDMQSVTHAVETPTLGQIVAYFKYQSTKQINLNDSCPGRKIWQRNYYERILRDENEMRRAQEYIFNNPMQWSIDRENPNQSASSTNLR